MRATSSLIAVVVLAVASKELFAAPTAAPYQNVVSAFVSADGGQTAICTNNNDKFQVIINGRKFGPFDETDCDAKSPFTSNGMWAFRAIESGKCRLIISGSSYGPYDEVWPPNFARRHWGALIKQNGKYHVLVDGTLSAGFDEIAGDHRLEEQFSLNSVSIDVPLFFGNDNWAAFGRNGDELFIVTRRQTYGPFAALADEQFKLSASDQSTAQLTNHLSFDLSTLALPISKNSGEGIAHYVWINGVEQGPADILPEFAAISATMSMNGRRWGFFDQTAIFTNQGKIVREKPRDVVVSDNGRTLMYAYGPDDNMRFVVNGREYGPYKAVLGMSCSPDGSRWVANYFTADDKHFAMTESGVVGPYGDIVTADGITVAIGARFIGNDWLWAGQLPDKKFAFLINGRSYGPYKSVASPGSGFARTTDLNWAASAVAEDRVDIFSTGRLISSTKPFKPGVVHAHGSHWHALGKIDDQAYLVEDGKFTSLGNVKQVLGEFHSENRARLAVRGRDENNQNFVIFSHKTYGPYPNIAGSGRFSADGRHWAFTARDAGEDGQTRVVSSTGESPAYAEIRDLTVTAQGATFVGKDANGQWWLHRGANRTGPFAGAGLTESNGRITTVVISNGNVQVDIGTSGTTNCYSPRRRFGRRRG